MLKIILNSLLIFCVGVVIAFMSDSYTITRKNTAAQEASKQNTNDYIGPEIDSTDPHLIKKRNPKALIVDGTTTKEELQNINHKLSFRPIVDTTVIEEKLYVKANSVLKRLDQSRINQ